MNLTVMPMKLVAKAIAVFRVFGQPPGSIPVAGNSGAIVKLTCFFVVVAALTTSPAADSTTDAKAVQGHWKPVKAELAGQSMSDDVLKTFTLKMENGNYEVFVGEHPDRGTYTLDATTTPKSITVTGTNGPNQGRIFPAIYELKGDALRICYDLSGVKRPAEFKSVAGTKLYLVTYQRKKE
jgi:uncharacterized protein (TIGR03067 family)